MTKVFAPLQDSPVPAWMLESTPETSGYAQLTIYRPRVGRPGEYEELRRGLSPVDLRALAAAATQAADAIDPPLAPDHGGTPILPDGIEKLAYSAELAPYGELTKYTVRLPGGFGGGGPLDVKAVLHESARLHGYKAEGPVMIKYIHGNPNGDFMAEGKARKIKP